MKTGVLDQNAQDLGSGYVNIAHGPDISTNRAAGKRLTGW
jgi:hypothetical protein